MVNGLKPSWQNLKGSGFATKNVVEEMVGQLVSWQLVANNFGGNNIEFQFSQCQIIASDVTYPYADWMMSIKYSDSQSSGWGIFGASAAQALGIDIELLDIDLLKGRWCHVVQSEHEFGDDKKAIPDPTTGELPKIKGNVFRLVELVQAGQSVQRVSIPVVGITPAPVVAPVAPAVAVAPVAAAVAVAEAPPVAVAGTMAPAVAGETPMQRALSLLHGKDLATFFQVAVPDPVVRGDATLVNSILTGAFVTAQIANGAVVKNEDGTHSVV